MKLIIVESPTKAKTISQFLGNDFKILSSYGHIRDLPKGQLGIDVEKDFEPKYVIPTKARKTVTALKKEAAKADSVILATDEDREGEAIAWHLAHALGLDEEKAERIVFHEITKRAIEDALEHPRKINLALVHAQQGRRILDRLVGYKLSPFLWKKIAGGLSAGRVQSVTVRLIVDRENEIRKFTPQEYWTIEVLYEKGGAVIEATLSKIKGKKLEKFTIVTKADAERIATELRNEQFSVSKIERKEISKSPSPPFTTSTLQQEAAKKLGFSTKKTMLLAQRLYEEGRITYMRTDSVNLSAESTVIAKSWLSSELGAPYATDAPRTYLAKSKLAQEAHEAVRPTDPRIVPESAGLTDIGQKKLYELIWRRFMASQMPNAALATISVDIVSTDKKYTLRATGQRITFDGYLKIWPHKLEERELPELYENDALPLREVKPTQHFTEPPPRYSEASLVKTLEEYGIGRPSTYAPTISTIQLRNYVIKEQGRFKPTEVGELVNKVLVENFPDIVDIGFTAQMEDELDEITEGQRSWQGIIGEFYKPFAKRLLEKYESVTKQDLTQEKTDAVCDKCGKPMVVKMSRFGKFLACSGLPDCKSTKKLSGDGTSAKEPPKSTGLKCSTCIEGDIVERRVHRGRARGKIFWGCSRYPDCKYATWENPTEEAKTEPKPSEPAETEAEN